MNGKSFLVLALSCILVGVLFLGCAQEQKTYTIKLAHEVPPTHPKGVWAENFKKYVEEKSKGRIKVEIYPQGQLYKDPATIIQATSKGTIQMSITSTGYVSTMIPQFQVVDLPMIFESQETLYHFQDGKVGAKLLKMLESKGLKGLGWVSNVPLDLFSKEKIYKPEDFKGKKIRVHTALLEEVIRSLGGNPVSMPASELYLALQQGVVDGAMTTVTYAASNHYEEVIKYVTVCRVSAITYPVVMNLEFWNKLPNDLKEVVKDGVRYATEQNRKDLSELEQKSLNSLEKGGVEIIQLTPEQKKEWQSAISKVYDKYKDVIGPDLIREVQEIT